MDEIKITNDGKEKEYSFEASISLSDSLDSHLSGGYTLNAWGYGDTEEGSRDALNRTIVQLINQLLELLIKETKNG
jgi:hypothetical protein